MKSVFGHAVQCPRPRDLYRKRAHSSRFRRCRILFFPRVSPKFSGGLLKSRIALNKLRQKDANTTNRQTNRECSFPSKIASFPTSNWCCASCTYVGRAAVIIFCARAWLMSSYPPQTRAQHETVFGAYSSTQTSAPVPVSTPRRFSSCSSLAGSNDAGKRSSPLR